MSLQWTDGLSVGVPEIDGQHRELIERLNRLVTALQRNDRAELTRLMSFLGAYVVEHFTAEEMQMLATGYPGYAEHKAQHAAFVSEYVNLKALLETEGSTATLTLKLSSTLSSWLVRHIYGNDIKLGAHLRVRGAAKQAGLPALPGRLAARSRLT